MTEILQQISELFQQPNALGIAAVIVVIFLWRAYAKLANERLQDKETRIAELRTQRDTAITGWNTQTKANEELVETNKINAEAYAALAKAWRDKARADNARRRRTDEDVA